MRAWKFGRDVNTDVIIPARYLNTSDPKELASHLMEDTDNVEFKNLYDSGKNSVEGDVFVAGPNFGSGSSREHAPIAIQEAGIKYIIAPSFARIFYRNGINIGLPLIECAETDKIEQGDDLEVIAEKGIIRNLTKKEEYQSTPIPQFMQELLDAGGLMAYRAQRSGYQGK